ncbi:head-tail connector protein [Pseudooceanicola sp. C21-150M6]|uniref:head-tail connector protein n=1 Tax=Pseudooceanicola sp. C21-150M6 TaxID=3434355 RepID=UPI003D7FDDF6
MTLVPILVTGPAGMPVTLDEAKLHARIDHDAEDNLVSGLISAAVGYLDGYRGILGRAIMPQTWKVYVPEAGCIVLPMPDCGDTVDVSYDDNSATTVSTLIAARGWQVELAQPGWVEFSCAMPAEQLPACEFAISALVAHWYRNREAVGDTSAPLPMAANAMISALRWRLL